LIRYAPVFYKIRTKLTPDIRRMIYFPFVHPSLLYDRPIEIYANTTMNHLAKLIKLNNKLLRILQQKPSRTHTVLLYRTYHTLPVQLLHDYQILVFMHKYVHNRHQLPSVFSAYFDENNLIHHYNTRKKMTFILMVLIWNWKEGH